MASEARELVDARGLAVDLRREAASLRAQAERLLRLANAQEQGDAGKDARRAAMREAVRLRMARGGDLDD